jgi:myosin heavy subunit
MSEGIDWTKVEFVDNQDCVDVIEAQPPKVRPALSAEQGVSLLVGLCRVCHCL